MAQLVGTQSGEPVVPVYNWASYLGVHFRSIPHLKQYQHIFSATHPGVVTLKEHSNSSEDNAGQWQLVSSRQRVGTTHQVQWSPPRTAVVSAQTDKALLQRGHRRPHLSKTILVTRHHHKHNHKENRGWS